jgi:dCTP deaminase
MILTDRQILESHRRGEILIEPFDEKQVQAASYDLRLGEQGITTSSKKIVNIREHGYLTVQPGDFGVVVVLEILRLDAMHVGRFGLRSKFARKGLLAATGPQIDPGYHGRLMIGVVNLSPQPIVLPYKDDFLTVEFHQLNEASTKQYSGPYQERLALGPEEIEAIAESEGLAFSEVITTLRSLSQNVAALTNQVKTFKWMIPAILGFGIAVIASIVALKK